MSLAYGRVEFLTLADDFNRECIDFAGDFGMGGTYVSRILDQADNIRGYPQIIRTYNGPEFICRAFMGRALDCGIKHC